MSHTISIITPNFEFNLILAIPNRIDQFCSSYEKSPFNPCMHNNSSQSAYLWICFFITIEPVKIRNSRSRIPNCKCIIEISIIICKYPYLIPTSLFQSNWRHQSQQYARKIEEMLYLFQLVFLLSLLQK